MRKALKKTLLSVIIVTAVLSASGILTTRSFAGKSKFSPHKLTILFTGDDFGNLKPSCG